MKVEPKIGEDKFADVPVRVKTWVFIIIAFSIGILHPFLMKIFISYLCFQSLFEFLRMFKVEVNKLIIAVLVAFSQLLLLFFFKLNDYLFCSVFLIVIILAYLIILKMRSKKTFLMTLALLICLFSLPFLSFLRDGNMGLKSIIFLVIVTELNDVFQYLMGKFCGKHKIVPGISPNKTVEGFIGGVLLTVILSNVLGGVLLETDFLLNTVLGVMLGVFGFLGDVTMSYFKRISEVKDTGTLLPGHGGLLDRIDSLIYNSPAFFFFIYLINA